MNQPTITIDGVRYVREDLSEADSTRYRGVSRSRGRFMASISVADRKVFLGRFERAEDAARAYDQAALRHHGLRARVNFRRGDGYGLPCPYLITPAS